MNASPRLWMFDFDNTIARLEPEVDWTGGRPVLERYLRSVGAPDELFTRIPRGNLPLYDAYRTLLLADGNAGESAAERLRHASEIIETLELAGVERAQELDGAIELLGLVRRAGASVAIVTSNSSRTVERWFNVRGVAQVDAQVDAIIGRDTLLALKPAPDMVTHALELFAAKPSEATFVGDSEADLAAARTAGVPFLAVATTDAARDLLLGLGAQNIFASPAALAIHLNLSGR